MYNVLVCQSQNTNRGPYTPIQFILVEGDRQEVLTYINTLLYDIHPITYNKTDIREKSLHMVDNVVVCHNHHTNRGPYTPRQVKLEEGDRQEVQTCIHTLLHDAHSCLLYTSDAADE